MRLAIACVILIRVGVVGTSLQHDTVSMDSVEQKGGLITMRKQGNWCVAEIKIAPNSGEEEIKLIQTEGNEFPEPWKGRNERLSELCTGLQGGQGSAWFQQTKVYILPYTVENRSVTITFSYYGAFKPSEVGQEGLEEFAKSFLTGNAIVESSAKSIADDMLKKKGR